MIRSIRRKAATAALAVGAAAGLVMTPAPAHAAAQANVELEICHSGATDLNVYIYGYNQNDQRLKSPLFHIAPYGCYSLSNWWWETNRTVEVDWNIPYSSPFIMYKFFIQGHAPDGTWVVATLTNV